MNGPVLDGRNMEELHRQVAALARAYTPEWRYERTEDDPGAALAELFCTMFHQTIDRFNRLPGKLYTEFLLQLGIQELPPVAAGGVMVFHPSDTVEEPVPVPGGTRVFAPDANGENIVYETQWSIQATPAQLLEVYYTDPAQDEIRRLDRDCPMAFFAPAGEPVQRHRLELGQNQVLQLDCPAAITLDFLDEAGSPAVELAQALAGEGLGWSYRHGGVQIPFDSVRCTHGSLVLEKATALALEPDGAGRLCLTCQGTPRRAIELNQVRVGSAPLAPCPAQRMFTGDEPIREEEGGYCFGRRPAPYSLFYLRSDTALSKAGAQVRLHLELSAVVQEPPDEGPQFQYDRHIIDKQGAVRARPDDTFVSDVTWEYFNGTGWRELPVAGIRNPFSGRFSGGVDTTFQVPADLAATEVNAETGFYIRVRVTQMENQFSQYQRWLLPFVRGATFQWSYPEGVRPDWVCGENHGARTSVEQADGYERLGLTVLSPMEPGFQAMYFRFDRSPHAAPLSLYVGIAGGTGMSEGLQWEWWDGRRFVPARSQDQTHGLGRSGTMQIFLPEPLPPARLFGQEGCWLRLSRTAARPVSGPVVSGLWPNAVSALQCQREPEQYFDTGLSDAQKEIRLLATPVQGCQVWVDEGGSLSAGELDALRRARPEDVELEWEGSQMTRCWVRWSPISHPALAGSADRVYVLDRYEGTIRFGDGRQGRMPPPGDHNIRVRYSSGGGVRGNLPAGSVTGLLEGLPFIADAVNLTAMSGGTERMSLEELEARGSRALRTRGRAAGRRDFEDLVRQAFPQVRHVGCFSGVDGGGNPAPGHVTVVLSGFGAPEEGEGLCQRVLDYLSPRCSCCLTAEGRLHVCPATVLTVNTQVTVTVERPELAADTQQEIARRLAELMEQVWKGRPIGSQVRLDEVWQTVRQVPNVELVGQILVEAVCRQGGVERLVPLEEDGAFPFGVVESGIHQVRVR